MAQNEIIKEVLSKTTDRRRMLQRLATATAALSAATMASGNLDAQAPPAGPAPVDVLQFALNLEYLEAEFYCLGAFGKTIDKQFGVGITGAGVAGPTTTPLTNLIAIGSPISFGQGLFGVIQSIAADEINHVILLRSALSAAGITPIAKPAINLDAFYPLGVSIAQQTGFLVHARIFEDIGVSAYGGGAQYLAGTPYLTTAARILAIEGEHVGNIRYQLSRLGIPAGLPLASNGNSPLDGADVLPPQSANLNVVSNNPSYVATASTATTFNGFNFFTTNSQVVPSVSGSSFPYTLTGNGLSPIRTPGQVLYLAYGVGLAPSNSVTAGGFFPAGVNGTLNTATSAATATGLQPA